MNYFELFGLPVSLVVDKAKLQQQFLQLQRQFHPDFYSQSSEAEQEEALEKSALLNQAVKVLQNPDAVLEHVLHIKGILQPDEKFALPPDFLMEVMELNEDWSADSADTIRQFQQDLQQQVQPIIDRFDAATITENELLQLKTFHYQKKYLQRMLDRTDS